MASERQIEANRRNAQKSTGPRSRASKKRSSRNAYRHGLALSPIANPALAKRVDRLARSISGNSRDSIILEQARTAAQAVLDLARVRQAKVALIKCISALGALEPPYDMPSVMKAWLYVELPLEGRTPRGRPPRMPEPIDSLATMPNEEPERTAEGVRRALPELRKLDRYESRAIARRDRAIREITKRSVYKLDNLK